MLWQLVKKQEVRNKFEIALTTRLHTHLHHLHHHLPTPPSPTTPLQEFQDEIAPIQDDVTHMNQLASTFGPHDVQLSAANLERLDDLNTRWKLLQVCCPPPPLSCQGGEKKNPGLITKCIRDALAFRGEGSTTPRCRCSQQRLIAA